jgi:hypothetical protein
LKRFTLTATERESLKAFLFSLSDRVPAAP